MIDLLLFWLFNLKQLSQTMVLLLNLEARFFFVPLFPFPFVTLRLFGPSARPSLAPRCWPGDPSARHIGWKPCGSAAPHSLYAAPGGDLPRSGCSYRPGITGTPACPLMGARRGSASSQLCGCDFLPPPRGDLPRSGVAFRSSSPSRPPTARLKGRTI